MPMEDPQKRPSIGHTDRSNEGTNTLLIDESQLNEEPWPHPSVFSLDTSPNIVRSTGDPAKDTIRLVSVLKRSIMDLS